jgi:DNA-binding IscR family transcriptional regulator
MEEQTYQLLRAIYDLAEGSPGRWVAGAEAAERAGIPFTTQDYDLLFRYLRQSGLITTDDLIHNEVCKLTPKGVRVVERVVAP